MLFRRSLQLIGGHWSQSIKWSRRTFEKYCLAWQQLLNWNAYSAHLDLCTPAPEIDWESKNPANSFSVSAFSINDWYKLIFQQKISFSIKIFKNQLNQAKIIKIRFKSSKNKNRIVSEPCGRPFGLFETSVCFKISKNLKVGPFGDRKNSKKKSHSAEKIQRGDPVVPSGFVSYVKNWVHERGDPLTNSDAFPLAGPVVL